MNIYLKLSKVVLFVFSVARKGHFLYWRFRNFLNNSFGNFQRHEHFNNLRYAKNKSKSKFLPDNQIKF